MKSASGCDCRGCEQLERLRPQPKLVTIGGEDVVSVRNRPRGSDTAARRHFEVSREIRWSSRQI